ncbi:MAG: 23S rRNA (uridine(2552)-2'-O)-methyltransferase RlmE [Chromatiales bacterium]|nr:23S rRNA (uridine(2552)-2'-O)-methyltransferase RlmE [Chromatiales bacterium]
MSKRRRSGWMQRHLSDPYVKLAEQQGWRSRATFKLAEIDRSEKLLRSGMSVVDLGAAPGGWSQYVVSRFGGACRVVALDILPMEEIDGVLVIQGDFRDEDVLRRLETALEKHKIDLVISDMAPNLSGVAAVDQPASIYLAELALAFSRDWLAPNGAFLVKVFQGEGFDPFLLELRKYFSKVKVCKPPASRSASREVYLLARNLRIV